jgi:DNA-binding NarL/FixJ family response regulator
MMGANDRSERCRGVAHPYEYENQRLRLIVADGTPGYLETVRNVSEFHGIVDLVGRGATFEETIQLAVHLRPDLVLMDIELPSAMVAIAAIIATATDVQIVGMFDACIPLHAAALILSVSAFIDKARLRNDLLPLLLALLRGRAASRAPGRLSFHADIKRQWHEQPLQLKRS